MKKILSLVLVLAITLFIFVGCSQKPATTTPAPTPAPATETPAPAAPATPAAPAAPATDAVTSASLVNEEGAFINAMSKEGTWIICTLKDLTTEKELVVDGEFHDKADATKDIYRKLALYAQDANRKVTARYTLTAPKLTVKSENFKIQGGTFKGDVYVEANGFNVSDATVDGNVYFATQEYKDSAVIATDAGKEGKVTGTMELVK